MEEIEVQEKELGIEFDCIVSATGSGGTYTGLLMGNHEEGKNRRIMGFAVGKNSEFFQEEVKGILEETTKYTGEKINLNEYKIEVNDGYVGAGYAISRKKSWNS